MFDAIFYSAYSECSQEIANNICSYVSRAQSRIDSSTTPQDQIINTLYNEVIPLGLQAQVPLIRETANKNGIDTEDNKCADVFNQLSTLSTDINTSQICIELKSYVISIGQSTPSLESQDA